MKMYGDVPQEYRDLAEKLVEEQIYWDKKALNSLDKEYNKIVAKAYTCLAHDWYAIGLDEKGSVLLELAEKVCPGYFKVEMLKQTELDEDFDYLVKSLSSQLAGIVLELVKNGSKL